MLERIMEVAGFKIDGDVVLKKHGTHHDVPYEVTNHARNVSLIYQRPRGTYCYYVFISELMLEPEKFEEFWLAATPSTWGARNGFIHPSYNYESAPWSDANWHGGVTWYSKEAGFDGEPRSVKIGCDFGH